MNDLDGRIRNIVEELVESAPAAPPYPTGRRTTHPRQTVPLLAALAIGVAIAVAVVIVHLTGTTSTTVAVGRGPTSPGNPLAGIERLFLQQLDSTRGKLPDGSLVAVTKVTQLGVKETTWAAFAQSSGYQVGSPPLPLRSHQLIYVEVVVGTFGVGSPPPAPSTWIFVRSIQPPYDPIFDTTDPEPRFPAWFNSLQNQGLNGPSSAKR